MELKTEQDIILLVEEDRWMMDILRAAKSLGLPDWWVCAGFVRSKIWDTLHGFPVRTPLPDVDVVYFDPANLDEQGEKQWERQLRRLIPEIPWSVKNEARMHLVNGLPPYASTVDAIAHFPETATALGLSLDGQDQVVLTAPHGIGDVVNVRLRPTLFFADTQEGAAIYERRIASKNWQSIWGKIEICHIRI